MRNLNPIIPSKPMRNAVTKTSETVNVQNTTLETKGYGQIASTDSTAARPAVYGEIAAEGLKAATNKIRSACYRFSSLQPDMEAWLESSAYSVIRAYHDATPAPEPQPEVKAEPVAWRAREIIDAWCVRYVEGMPPVTTRDKLIADILAASVCVKPLKWLGLTCPTTIGIYRIKEVSGNWVVTYEDAFPAYYDTLETAKAAAQSDYSSRVLAALTTPPVVEEAVKAEREACAQLVAGQVYKTRYRTWPFWEQQPDGTRGNLANESRLVRHCDELAAAIRARSATP